MLRIVLIAEKPAMARAWARALHDEPEPVKPHDFVTSVYHFERDYKGSLARWCVSSTIGHFTETRMSGGLARQSNGGASPKMFTRELIDDCLRPKQKKMREQLRQLACNSDLLFLALDADMEGEFIARQVQLISSSSSHPFHVSHAGVGSLPLDSGISCPLGLLKTQRLRRMLVKFVDKWTTGVAPTLTLSAFVDRHQEHLAGALPKFSASRQERRAAKEGEEDFEPSLSYGPVQTPTIFLALHHFVVESSKKTSQGTWRVKVSLYSESTVEFECYSEPLRSEEDAKKQKEVIDMVLKQRRPEQSDSREGLEDCEASSEESSQLSPSKLDRKAPESAESAEGAEKSRVQRPMAPKDAAAEQQKGAVVKAEKSVAVEVKQIRNELVPGFERPKPLNFVGLMKLAAAYGFDPPYTERLAQNLYEMGYISYPRTESSQYSEDEEAELEHTVRDLARAPLPMLRQYGLNAGGDIQAYAKRLLEADKLQRPRKGVATGDHEPITPSLQSDHLFRRFSSAFGRLQREENARERKDTMTLYDLILRYFLASLSPDCVMQARTVTLAFVDVEIPFSGQFRVQHRTQLDQGWLEILPRYSPLAAGW
ncbi:Top3b [Symbiodinium sp. KB8]|nr:Top3b [Symbiodinium sp. KB8]